MLQAAALNLAGEPDQHTRAARNKESDMTIHDAYPEHLGESGDGHTIPAQRHAGVLERWRGRQRPRLMGARRQRMLARRLRQIARDAHDRDLIRRRHDVLLHYRAAAVRTDLLEIAALLEQAHNPDPDCVAALHNLLANHPGDSPLYNPNIPFTELQTTLDQIGTGLSSRPSTEVLTDEKGGRCAS